MKFISRKLIYFFYLLTFCGSISCNSDVLFESNKQIVNNAWEVNKPLIFTTQIQDTINGYDVFINLRNSGTYPFSNLFLFLNTRFPDGRYDRDTLEIRLAAPDGKWLGKSVGDIWDNRILFKSAVRFPQKGEYRFEFIQAMRMNPLPGILDGGMRIELSNQK